MEEIIERYRVLSFLLSDANLRIRCIRHIVAKNIYPFNPIAVDDYIKKIEDEKRLINADIDSLACQVPITQRFIV